MGSLVVVVSSQRRWITMTYLEVTIDERRSLCRSSCRKSNLAKAESAGDSPFVDSGALFAKVAVLRRVHVHIHTFLSLA